MKYARLLICFILELKEKREEIKWSICVYRIKVRIRRSGLFPRYVIRDYITSTFVFIYNDITEI